jgi:aryl carrier-like protein
VAGAEPILLPDLPREDDGSPSLPPASCSEREQAVCGIFAEILGLARVDPGDNFFHLGGDSLIATQLTAWIRRSYQTNLSLKEVFTAPTPQALAALLDRRLSTPTPSLSREEA